MDKPCVLVQPTVPKPATKMVPTKGNKRRRRVVVWRFMDSTGRWHERRNWREAEKLYIEHIDRYEDAVNAFKPAEDRLPEVA